MSKHYDLHDYETGDRIRAATDEEYRSSAEAARRDGGAGVIDVEGRRCYCPEAAAVIAEEDGGRTEFKFAGKTYRATDPVWRVLQDLHEGALEATDPEAHRAIGAIMAAVLEIESKTGNVQEV